MDLKKAKETLIQKEYTCVVCKGDELYTSIFRGVKPLVKWVAEGKDFTGFSAADKVIGKATAFLYVLLNVKAVYAVVISHSALEVLQEAGIEVEYGMLVEGDFGDLSFQGTRYLGFQRKVKSCDL